MIRIVKLCSVAVLAVVFYYISTNIIALEQAGMDYILWIQGIRSAELDFIMRVGTIFGFEFFFVLIPLLAWWGDNKHQKLGASLFTLLLLVLFCVSFLKATFTRPRPFVMNAGIAEPNHLPDKIEFSFPSGHAWASTTFFFIAKYMQGAVYWLAAVILSAYTLFSRVYFGVHYPHDLAAGIACGIILLILFTYAEDFLDTLFTHSEALLHEVVHDDKNKSYLSPRMKKQLFNIPNAAAMLLLIFSAGVNYSMDETIKNKQQGIIFVPFCLLGFILCRPFMPHLKCVSLKYRLIRLFVGVPIIFSLYFLYRLGGPGMRPVVATFVGGWLFCVAPIIFMKLGLVQPPPPHSHSHHSSSRVIKQE